jgi:REP element-mobilizing transposase RayT
MARPWRIQFPDAIYHIHARGNNRQEIFLDDRDREDFLGLLGEAVSRFRLQVFAFCLMTNHYHLFLRTPEPNLAAAMHWLNGTYTNRFNRRNRRSGHLLQGRYQAVVVAEESHWLHLSMYLHLNPVRARMVEDPADYAWSSFRDWTRPASRFEWLRPGLLLAEYGESESQQRRQYRRQCLALAGTQPNWVEQFRTAVFLGSREVWEELARRYQPGGRSEAVPEFQAAKRRKVDLEAELWRVAEAFGIEPAELGQRRRKHWPRLAAYQHLVVNCGVRVREVADRMGVSPAAVTLGIKSLQGHLETRPELKEALLKLTKN